MKIFVTSPHDRYAPACKGDAPPPVSLATWVRTPSKEGTRPAYGRENPGNPGLYVSVLASDLSLDQGPDRSIRRSGDPARSPTDRARSVRADGRAARQRSSLLRQAGPGPVSGHPA